MAFKTLVTGLGGAIGCDLRRAQNQLLFVEYSGKLSRLNLFRTGTIVSSGTGVLHGTWLFDFDAGAQVAGGPSADVWWQSARPRCCAPSTRSSGAALANLGHVDFASITPDTLSSLTYSTTPIDGNNDATNKLTTNDVFAVRDVLRQLREGQGRRVRLRPAAPVGHVPPRLAVPRARNRLHESRGREGERRRRARVRDRAEWRPRACRARQREPAVGDGRRVGHDCAAADVPRRDAPRRLRRRVRAVAARLWRIDLTSGTKVAVLSNLENAVGVVLSADLQSAYISEQAAARRPRQPIRPDQRDAPRARHRPDGAVLPDLARPGADVRCSSPSATPRTA